MENFQILQNYIIETNNSNSINDKLEVLKKYQDNEFLKKIFYYTYNPFFQFHVTVANLSKRQDLATATKEYKSFFDLLDDLHKCIITGHEAIANVNAFINRYKDFEKELHYVIDRNLETRITTTLINRIIPNLIPEFDVALCEDYDKVKDNKKPNFDTETWYASRKLDGLRMIAVVDGNSDAIFYSRAGKEFKTFAKVAAEIKRLGFKNIVLDGEACLLKENGADDFSGIMKEYSKKNHTIQNPRYRLFDCLTVEEFGEKISKTTFSERLSRLDWLKDSDSEIIKKLQQDKVVSLTHFQEIRTQAANLGYEGLILRKDVTYEGKRSKNMLKVKQFYDAEYVVEDIISDMMRVIVDGLDEDTHFRIDRSFTVPEKNIGSVKVEQTEMMLKAVVIRHKGFIVRVGSGFSMEQRRLFHKDPSLIIGKTVCVKYFEESTNQQNELSLRFPIIKHIYNEKRDV